MIWTPGARRWMTLMTSLIAAPDRDVVGHHFLEYEALFDRVRRITHGHQFSSWRGPVQELKCLTNRDATAGNVNVLWQQFIDIAPT